MAAVSLQFKMHLQERFSGFFQEEVSVHSVTHHAGGAINQCYIIDTSKGVFLMKLNSAMFGLDMFEKEAAGLTTLADAGVVKVPRPLFDGKFHQQIFLIIEFAAQGEPGADFWEDFGSSIARLHQNSNDNFGLFYDNYIGKLRQPNNPEMNWNIFYGQNRLLHFGKKAVAKGLLDNTQLTHLETIVSKLDTILPAEQPALLHGDLWPGNFLVGENGKAVIFDPAVYFGNREVDLAMSLLFGGFEKRFYEAYQYHHPLEANWQKRIRLYQLYPLLVHLILFGGDYHNQVVNAIQQYK